MPVPKLEDGQHFKKVSIALEERSKTSILTVWSAATAMEMGDPMIIAQASPLRPKGPGWDGVGDVCDVCPDVFDPAQANTDHLGQGDACNDNGDSACPYSRYPMTACSVDGDGDEVDTYEYRCANGAILCDAATQDVEKIPLDNCPSWPTQNRKTRMAMAPVMPVMMMMGMASTMKKTIPRWKTRRKKTRRRWRW